MKLCFLRFFAIGIFFGIPASAQRPVSSALQPRKVLLEQFTGIHCATCPAAHRIADSLKAVKPAGSVLLMNVHTGGLAAPNVGEPDYRFSQGQFYTYMPGSGPTVFPSGYANRQRLFGANLDPLLIPGQWSAAIDSVRLQMAPFNIAVDAMLNVTTRQLTVSFDIYGQSIITSGTYVSIRVYVLEDGVLSPQLGKELYPAQINPIDSSYVQNNVLRADLSSNYGAYGNLGYGFVLTGGFNSSVIPAQYNNIIPALGNLKVMVVVANATDSSIYNLATGPISYTGFGASRDAQIMPDVRIEKEVCEATLKPIVRIYNNGSQPITSATLQSSLNGGAFLPAGSFSGSIRPATSAFVAVPPISFSPNATNDIKFKIVNVNGSPDPFPVNDTLTVSNILRTTRLAKGKYQVMRFTQDRWGAETTWKIVEEGSGIVKLAGGPYPTLNNNGTAAHVDSFLATGETCYEILVSDAGDNGINSGSGTGSYRVTSNGLVVYASNGTYGSRDRALFKTAENLTTLPTGIAFIPDFAQSVSLSPNPTAGETNLLFSLASGTKLSVQVVDMTGRIVAQIADQNLSAGSHALPISMVNLAGGVYNIRLATAEGVVMRRLVVVK